MTAHLADSRADHAQLLLFGGTIGGGVMTETGSDGTTVHYADDTGTRVPVAVNDANVRGLEIVVRSPAC